MYGLTTNFYDNISPHYFLFLVILLLFIFSLFLFILINLRILKTLKRRTKLGTKRIKADTRKALKDETDVTHLKESKELFSLDKTFEEKVTLLRCIHFQHYAQTSAFLQIKNKLKNMHLFSINDLNNLEVNCIMLVAERCKEIIKLNKSCTACSGKVLSLLFYEVSTRTRCSFEIAMHRLGGAVCTIEDATKTSSVKKGECLSDTLSVLGSYSDCIVLRFPNPMEDSTLRKIKQNLTNRAIINAGDGYFEHPTQALLDMFTIKEYFPSTFLSDNKIPLTITFVGDLLFGRTVHSLVKLLSRYNTKFIYVAPSILQIEDVTTSEVERIFTKNNFDPSNRQKKTEDLKSAISVSDIVYVSRFQRERFSELIEISEDEEKSFHIDAHLLDSYGKANLKVMHPLPRAGELSEDVDGKEYAAYFTQCENGLYLRMSILALSLDRAHLLFN